MSRYTAQTLPEGGFLVVSAEPDFRGGALVPGEVCPCPAGVDRFEVRSRIVQERREHCGIRLQVQTQRWTKNEYDPGSGRDEIAWNAEPDELEQTITDRRDGTCHSLNRLVNDDALLSEITPCGILSTGIVAGDEPANHPDAEYTLTESSTTTEDCPPVGFGSFPQFSGPFTQLYQGAAAAKSDDGLETFARASQWHWQLDLSAWPTGRAWPEEFVLKGTLVWDVVVRRYANATPDIETISRSRVTENYEVNAARPIWQSAVYSTIVLPESAGRGAIAEIERISGFEIWLPLD